MGRNNHQKVTSEWIPVTERFPKNISTVIVQVKNLKSQHLDGMALSMDGDCQTMIIRA